MKYFGNNEITEIHFFGPLYDSQCIAVGSWCAQCGSRECGCLAPFTRMEFESKHLVIKMSGLVVECKDLEELLSVGSIVGSSRL